MRKFNLNDYVFVQITDYGWEYLQRTCDPGFIEHCIRSKAHVIEGEVWYKLQAYNIPEWFGGALWFTHPCPINSNILIPEPLEVE